MNELDILLYLGKRGAFVSPISVTTSGMGAELGESQQNISRWLIKMENSGLIYRKSGIRGYLVTITPEGEEFILNLRRDIEIALTKKNNIKIRGLVKTGLGDGKYYMAQKEYVDEIRKQLGFNPYPGTLNIEITNMSELRKKEYIYSQTGFDIKSFTKGNHIFGALKCFRCKLNGINCALVIPERSHHPFNILEIISPFELRKKLKLKDEDSIDIDISVNEK